MFVEDLYEYINTLVVFYTEQDRRETYLEVVQIARAMDEAVRAPNRNRSARFNFDSNHSY